MASEVSVELPPGLQAAISCSRYFPRGSIHYSIPKAEICILITPDTHYSQGFGIGFQNMPVWNFIFYKYWQWNSWLWGILSVLP
jgi:hypothetical protein